MIINPLDAHDRLKHFNTQSVDISQCCQDIINQRPFGSHAFYIYAHKRAIELDERISMFNQDLTATLTDLSHKQRWKTLDEVPSGRLIWQPRLTRPIPQTNSMLFKAYPGTDEIKVMWIIPPRELWSQYDKGLVTENKVVKDSINDFQFNRSKLETPEDDDLTDAQAAAVYQELQREAAMKQNRMKQWSPILG